MIVRFADPETDALQIVDGAKDFASRVAFQHLLPDAEWQLTAAIGRVVTLSGFTALVAEDDGRIVGGIGLLFAPFLWNPAITVADELFWWTAPDAPFRTAKTLLTEALALIDARGAVPTFRALATSPAGVDRAYRRMGLVPLETVYMRAC